MTTTIAIAALVMSLLALLVASVAWCKSGDACDEAFQATMKLDELEADMEKLGETVGSISKRMTETAKAVMSGQIK